MALFKKHRTAVFYTRQYFDIYPVIIPVNITLQEAHRLIGLYDPVTSVEKWGDDTRTTYNISNDIWIVITETMV